MSLQDVIKINQLVRGRIDRESFNEWYAQLPPHEQQDLISFLHDFAYQAGVDAQTWADALSFVGLGSDTEVVRDIKSFHLPGLHLAADFRRWLAKRSDDDIHNLVILVYLFGVAEGTVFRNETLDSCNHWWHRDLLNPLVVEAILSDPQYYRTSMKDDERITHCTGCG